MSHATLIAQLEDEDAKAMAWREALGTAITVLKTLEARTPPLNPERRKTPRPKPVKALAAPKAPRKSGGKPTDPVKLEQARRVAEKDGLMAAAKATGLNYATLYGRAKAGRWKLPARGRGGRPPKVKLEPEPTAPLPTGKRSGVLRVCSKCSQRTVFDPCQHCGAPWNRARSAD